MRRFERTGHEEVGVVSPSAWSGADWEAQR
jgi:hypothetical protein